MKFQLPLLAVQDVEVSKKFYDQLFDQEVVLDLMKNVIFNGGFAIQEGINKHTPTAAHREVLPVKIDVLPSQAADLANAKPRVVSDLNGQQCRIAFLSGDRDCDIWCV